MIDPEVDGAAARKKSKQRLSPFLRQHVPRQIPKPAFRAKYVTRNQFLWSTVAHFLIRHVQNIKGRTGSISVFHLAPSLIDDSPKAALDPDVVLKYKSIGGS